VAPQTVYLWLAGRRVPRLEHAASLVQISAGAVTLNDLVMHGKEVRGERERTR
jgi:hypothetical protein